MNDAPIGWDNCRLDHLAFGAELIVGTHGDLANRLHPIVDLLRIADGNEIVLQHRLLRHRLGMGPA